MTSRYGHRPFDFNGNHLVVDFINTVNARPAFTRDDLATADDVYEWAEAAGLSTSGHPVNPQQDLRSFEAIIELRENMYRVLGPIAAGGEPDPGAVTFLSAGAASAIASAQWTRVGSASRSRGGRDALSTRSATVWPTRRCRCCVVRRSPGWVRVRAVVGCSSTRRAAHARRWCSMNACGVRDKMRRYHRRQAMP